MYRSTLLALSLVLIPACSNEPSRATQAPAPGSARAAELSDHDSTLAHELVAKGAVLLDVRSPDEFGDKHLPGAINIPVADLEGRLAEVQKIVGGDGKKPIVVYCASGNRSRKAKKLLGGAGFTQVLDLGAIDNWNRK